MRRNNSATRQKQFLLRLYMEETGNDEFKPLEVARWAVGRGVPLPKPADPLERLARQFAEAARNDIGHDPDNGRPFRRYVAVPQDGQLSFTWMEIHHAPRHVMRKALVHRREQMVGDGLQLSFDRLYWNKIHPEEEPIRLSMDLSDDIEERLNAPSDDDEAT